MEIGVTSFKTVHSDASLLWRILEEIKFGDQIDLSSIDSESM